MVTSSKLSHVLTEYDVYFVILLIYLLIYGKLNLNYSLWSDLTQILTHVYVYLSVCLYL